MVDPDPQKHKINLQNFQKKIGYWRQTIWLKILQYFQASPPQLATNRSNRLMDAHLKLIDYTLHTSYKSFLPEALDEISEALQSQVAFFHLVEPDQKTISLQGWSGRTLKEFCKAEGDGLHYALDKAGVWADCVRFGGPVIHNDYPHLKNRKGLPEGHAHVSRELVVPVKRLDRIVGILGVGNKMNPYDNSDVEMLSYLADVMFLLFETKRASSELESSREFNENLLKTIPFPMDIVNREGQVLFASEQMIQLLGYNPTGKKCWDVYKDDHKPCEHCPLKTNWNFAESKTLEVSGTFKGRVVEISLTKFQFEGQEAMLEIFHDITDRKHIEMQMMQSDRLANLGLLSASVAHEINTPLGTMKLFLSQLKNELQENPDIKTLQEITQKLEISTDRISKTIQSMRMLSRDSSKDPMSIHSLKTMLEDVSGVLRERFKENKAELKILPLTEDFKILCRPSEISQVLVNILNNAFDAISILPEKWVEIRVKQVQNMSLSVLQNFVRIEITDSGQGIPKEIIPKIFDPFFTTKEFGKGTGLGLSISHLIISKHGGILEVNSASPNTQFVISLPLVRDLS